MLFTFLYILNFSLAAPLDFQAALEQILDKSTDIKIQKSNLSASEYRLTASKLNFLPTFGVEATYDQDEDINYGAVAKWNLFRFGADKAGLDSALKGVESEKYKLQSATLEFESKAVNALIGSIRKSLQIQLLEKNIENRKKYVDIANQRFRKSYLPKEEVDKVSLDLWNTEARLKDVEREKLAVQAQLQALFLDSEVKSQWPWKERFQNVSKLMAASKNAEIHPEFKAVSLNAEKEKYRALQLKRFIWPSLDLSYSYLIEDADRTKIETRTGLVTLSIPLFDGFRDWSNYKVQNEIALIAHLQKNQSQKEIEGQQFEAQENFKLALDTALAREKTLDIARKLYQTNFARFRLGRADANELSLDENRLIESELNAVEGWANAHISYMKLKHAFAESIR